MIVPQRIQDQRDDKTFLVDVLEYKTEPPPTKNPEPDEFNAKAFCITFAWGWVLAGTIGVILLAFSELPILTTAVLSDLLNTFQIFIILISLLITYKILTLTEPAISRFLQKVRDTYIAKSGEEMDEDHVIRNRKDFDNFEAAGCLMGELADVVVHKLPNIAGT